MNEFALIFRLDIPIDGDKPSEEQMKTYMQQWTTWIVTIADKGQLAPGENHFSKSGTVIRSKNQIDEIPIESTNESVAGYILILARDIKDAIKIAEECPVLSSENTSIEIREVAPAPEV